jgi:hypothetical protein
MFVCWTCGMSAGRSNRMSMLCGVGRGFETRIRVTWNARCRQMSVYSFVVDGGRNLRSLTLLELFGGLVEWLWPMAVNHGCVRRQGWKFGTSVPKSFKWIDIKIAQRGEGMEV